MSRSKRGGKPIGYDYWGRRPGNSRGGGHHSHRGNNWTKRLTHKAERRLNRANPDEIADVMYDRYAEPLLATAEDASLFA